MKMKHTYKLIILILTLSVVSCSPTPEQKAKEEKRIEEAITKAQHMADSLSEIEYQLILSDTTCSCDSAN